VNLDLTAGDQHYVSDTTIEFACRRPGASSFVEIIAPSIERAELNGRSLPPSAHDGNRLQLDGLDATNVLTVRAMPPYLNEGIGLSRFEDPVDGRIYLHSQFAEYAAHRTFACFDQPDLKATFTFEVKTPADWVAVSNTHGAVFDGVWTFQRTPVLSSYVTAIVAGHYNPIEQHHRGIPLGLYCRQSLAQYLDPEEIFELTRQGLDFFEQRFGYPYPFGKYDQLFVPEFSAGAMENAGCVTFNENYLFRSRVTEARREWRAGTILHEMAHMWFGDLVTMRWWDDVWLNESFAEYMGYLASVQATRFNRAWIEFASGSKAAAKAQDQLPTTHPIVSDIPDMEALPLNFDRITYEKGAAVLKQLVAWVGDEAFFKGVEAYFKRHAYGNTELVDFLAALEESSGRELRSWSGLWLERAGVNTLGVELENQGDHILAAALVQEAPAEQPTLRPHKLRVGLFDLKGTALERRESVELDIAGPRTPLPRLVGQGVPDLVLANDGDLTYAKLKLDQRSLATLRTHLLGLDDGLARAVAWGALWDMARDAQLRASEYVETSLHNIDVENEPTSVVILVDRLVNALEVLAGPRRRASLRAGLAATARDRMMRMAPGSDMQLQWVQTFIGNARAPEDVAWVAGLLDGTTRIDGLEVDFGIRWSAVQALATIGKAGEDLIAAELARDPTHMGRRSAATARAVRPLPEAKAEAWSAVVTDHSVPLAMKRAYGLGFHRVDQETLLSAYVEPYFESLLPVWGSYEIEQALEIIGGMFPRTIVTQEVVDTTSRWLDRDLPAPIHRELLESVDGIKRALRARAVDGS
jgi:aminopeptidase N